MPRAAQAGNLVATRLPDRQAAPRHVRRFTIVIGAPAESLLFGGSAGRLDHSHISTTNSMRARGRKIHNHNAATETGAGLTQLAKVELIRKFQRLEGNYDCCASAYVKVCKQIGCLWRSECLMMELES